MLEKHSRALDIDGPDMIEEEDGKGWPSPVWKYNDTEQRGNEASLRLPPVPVAEDGCNPSEGKASVLAQNSSPRN